MRTVLHTFQYYVNSLYETRLKEPRDIARSIDQSIEKILDRRFEGLMSVEEYGEEYGAAWSMVQQARMRDQFHSCGRHPMAQFYARKNVTGC